MITYAKRDEIGIKFSKEMILLFSLKKIILFGSTSRKNDHLNSDVDIALIGYQKKLHHKEKEEINDIVTELMLNTDILINWIYFNNDEWDENLIPIIRTIKKEGILLWESEKI